VKAPVCRCVQAFIALLPLLSACGTIVNGTRQTVAIRSRPPGATALVLPDNLTVTTPAEVELDRVRAHTVRVELQGYCRETVHIDRVTSESTMGNVLVGGLVGHTIDASSGGGWDLKPGAVDVTLRPADGSVASFLECDRGHMPSAAH